MIAKTAGTGFIQTKREPSPFSLEHADVTMNIVVSGVGEFFGCAKECHQAYEEAALNLVQFTKKLLDLLESFQIGKSREHPGLATLLTLLLFASSLRAHQVGHPDSRRAQPDGQQQAADSHTKH